MEIHSLLKKHPSWEITIKANSTRYEFKAERFNPVIVLGPVQINTSTIEKLGHSPIDNVCNVIGKKIKEEERKIKKLRERSNGNI